MRYSRFNTLQSFDFIVMTVLCLFEVYVDMVRKRKLEIVLKDNTLKGIRVRDLLRSAYTPEYANCQLSDTSVI